MYAIIQTGGKQYRVSKGDKIKIELIDAMAGDTIRFNDVRLVGNGTDIKVGTPSLTETSVTGQVLRHDRHPKVVIFKHKRRKNYRRKKGHRQFFTEVQITGVDG